MPGCKSPDFNTRMAAARAAKQATKEKALDQLRGKAPADPAIVAERLEAQARRDAAAADRRASRQQAIEAEKAAKESRQAEESARDAPAEKPVRTEAELKAARDARYAARKARQR